MSIRIPLAETILKHAKSYKKPSNEKAILDGLKEEAAVGRTSYWYHDTSLNAEEVARLTELFTSKGYHVHSSPMYKIVKKEVPFSWFRPFRFEYEYVSEATGEYDLIVSLVPLDRDALLGFGDE